GLLRWCIGGWRSPVARQRISLRATTSKNSPVKTSAPSMMGCTRRCGSGDARKPFAKQALSRAGGRYAMHCGNVMGMLALAALLMAPREAHAGKTRDFHFAKGDVGKVPAGWKATQTNKGEGSVWKVVADDTAPSKTGLVLAQTAASPDAVFNLCVA